MENFPKAVDYVAQIDPYDAGKPLSGIAKEIGIRTDRLMLLNANENPLGVSEAAKKSSHRRAHSYEPLSGWERFCVEKGSC